MAVSGSGEGALHIHRHVCLSLPIEFRGREGGSSELRKGEKLESAKGGPSIPNGRFQSCYLVVIF